MHNNTFVKVNNQDFRLKSNIGSGGQGEIYSAVNKIENKTIAIKFVDFIKPGKWRHFNIERSNAAILKQRNLDYLCNIIECSEYDGYGIIAMDKYDCDLFNFALELNGGIPEDICKNIFQKICIGLKNMHSS